MDKIKRFFSLLLPPCFGLLLAAGVASGYGFGGQMGHPDGAGRTAPELDAGGQRPGPALVTGTTYSYLPLVFRESFKPSYDMVDFLSGDRYLYEVQHSSGSQARHQTQVEDDVFYHTKGNELSAEWEELWYTQDFIYRGTDTSPGNGQYYTLRDDGLYGSAWSPRFWNVGDQFERNPHVTFYEKSDCSPDVSGHQQSWLLFEAFHSQYTFESGITLENVVQLAWLPEKGGDPIERYYYAHEYGLVGWWSNNQGMSYVSEVHAPGDRPDNTREEIPCLDRSAIPAPPLTDTLPYWPGQHRR